LINSSEFHHLTIGEATSADRSQLDTFNSTGNSDCTPFNVIVATITLCAQASTAINCYGEFFLKDFVKFVCDNFFKNTKDAFLSLLFVHVMCVCVLGLAALGFCYNLVEQFQFFGRASRTSGSPEPSRFMFYCSALADAHSLQNPTARLFKQYPASVEDNFYLNLLHTFLGFEAFTTAVVDCKQCPVAQWLFATSCKSEYRSTCSGHLCTQCGRGAEFKERVIRGCIDAYLCAKPTSVSSSSSVALPLPSRQLFSFSSVHNDLDGAAPALPAVPHPSVPGNSYVLLPWTELVDNCSRKCMLCDSGTCNGSLRSCHKLTTIVSKRACYYCGFLGMGCSQIACKNSGNLRWPSTSRAEYCIFCFSPNNGHDCQPKTDVSLRIKALCLFTMHAAEMKAEKVKEIFDNIQEKVMVDFIRTSILHLLSPSRSFLPLSPEILSPAQYPTKTLSPYQHESASDFGVILMLLYFYNSASSGFGASSGKLLRLSSPPTPPPPPPTHTHTHARTDKHHKFLHVIVFSLLLCNVIYFILN
jgi:hypothetical protein